MSEYIKTKTQFKSLYLPELVKALEDITPAWNGKVELHPAGAEMVGWHDRFTAQVIVRRATAIGGWGDLGFIARADGTLEMAADDGHRQRGGIGAEWLQRLTQAYAYRVAAKQAAAAGLSICREVRQDGSWRVTLSKRPVALAGRAW